MQVWTLFRGGGKSTFFPSYVPGDMDLFGTTNYEQKPYTNPD